MPTVVSVSIGSSRRDHEASIEVLGQTFHVRRVGTDGDLKRAAALLEELDGQVDAIGLGGIDIYLYSRTRRYALRDGLRLMQVVKETPVVDGSGLKNTLERETIRILDNEGILRLRDRPVLMVCAMDRFGMAQALEETGARVVYGDLIFGLQVDQPIHSLEELEIRADKLLPDVAKLPHSVLYPTGKKQEQIEPHPMTAPYFEAAEIVA
ncbi:MAG: quinate 5-dehydrogenase, partial [Armatimonadetes bacterium]|nr:quinate 5-dehydrogenase [Armatimonadota bacterium]